MSIKKEILSLWLPLLLSTGLTLLQLIPMPSAKQEAIYMYYFQNRVNKENKDNATNNATIKEYNPKETIDLSQANVKSLLKTFLWHWKFYIALVMLTIIVVLLIISYHFDKSTERWTRTYLQTCMNELFPSPKEVARCTIFIKKRGIFVMFRYLFRAFILCGKQHYNEGTLLLHLKRIPNPFKEYFSIFVRVNEPYREGTSTYFNISQKETDSNGIVSHCAYLKMAQTVETEFISSFYDTRKTTFHGQTSKFRKYLQDCRITQEQLKCIHRPSNHIYAIPITDIYETKTLAVLVVDIDSPNKDCFVNDIPNRLGTIARVVTTIIRKDY